MQQQHTPINRKRNIPNSATPKSAHSLYTPSMNNPTPTSNNNGSWSRGQGTSPVPISNQNDDARERRQRRKSGMERRRGDESHGWRRPTMTVKLPALTPEELNSRFEEWMKIAADNQDRN
ncbi:hypothetical protein AX774_g385 [Zancudomyces culisetae]|uniref:Uncharacterized protein n=1 Tax=Zancudomyces culisetae TaxID=1213189 RepID=A0A1R1PYR4_ZANCU|nr:hypothetical protein AX774_g385 [Zancudomyces culisetae]|eukprot:OMH86069.1 hypothetical protein AX774_g385 [Zancudomyces culisetae]